MIFRRRGNRDRDGNTAGQPPTAAALDEAMTAVSVNDTAETRKRLYELYLSAAVIVATPAPVSPGSRTLPAGEKVAFRTVADDNGGTFLPVFTSVDALQRWNAGEPTAYLEVSARSLFGLIADDGGTTIWINPGSLVEGTISPKEIHDLARGRLPIGNTAVVTHRQSVEIAPLASLPPEDLLHAVRSALGAQSAIDAAWGFLMRQGALAPETAIGVGFVNGTTDDEVDAAMRAAVDDACRRSEAAYALRFLVATGDLRATLVSGGGLVLYPTAP